MWGGYGLIRPGQIGKGKFQKPTSKSLERTKALSSALNVYVFPSSYLFAAPGEGEEQPPVLSVGACHCVITILYFQLKQRVAS